MATYLLSTANKLSQKIYRYIDICTHTHTHWCCFALMHPNGSMNKNLSYPASEVGPNKCLSKTEEDL